MRERTKKISSRNLPILLDFTDYLLLYMALEIYGFKSIIGIVTILFFTCKTIVALAHYIATDKVDLLNKKKPNEDK